MFGCCAPEGMRAIYTAWTETIGRLPASPLGPAGVYVNMSLSRASPWGEVVSFMPDAGRLTVKAAARDAFFLRPPHWAPHDRVRAFVGTKPVAVRWSGDYVRFDASPGDELTITYPLDRVHPPRRRPVAQDSAPELRDDLPMAGEHGDLRRPGDDADAAVPGRPRVLPTAPVLD